MQSYLLRSTSLWKNFSSVSTTSRVFFTKGTEENRITNRKKVYKRKLGNTIIPFSFSACICMFVCEWAHMHGYIHMRVEAELHIWYFSISLHLIEVGSVVQPVTSWCCLVLLIKVLQGHLSLPLVLWDYSVYK